MILAEFRAEFLMYQVNGGAKRLAKFDRRVSADCGCDGGVGSLFDPQAEVAHVELTDAGALVYVKRLVNEILDRGQHRRNQAGVLGCDVRRGNRQQQKSGVPVKQQYLLHPIDEGAEQHDFRKGLAGAPTFQPPSPTLDGEATIENLVQRLQHFAKCSRHCHSNRRHDRWGRGTRPTSAAPGARSVSTPLRRWVPGLPQALSLAC